MLAARLQKAWDRAPQADGRRKETDTCSPMEFALVSRRKKNAVVAAVQINKRGENGEGGEAPASSGYTNTACLPG